MAPEGGFDLAAWQQNHWVLKNDKQVQNSEPGLQTGEALANHWRASKRRRSRLSWE